MLYIGIGYYNDILNLLLNNQVPIGNPARRDIPLYNLSITATSVRFKKMKTNEVPILSQ